MEFLTKNSLNLNSGREIIAKNFANWSSGNKIIDNLIQEKQLKYDKYDVVFEWIPYIKLIDIREIGNNGLATAIWKEGLLHYCRHEWIRIPYEKVALRFLYDSQNISDEFINEVKSYDSLLFEAIWKDGPLYYDTSKKEWIRESPHERVCLRYLHNSQYEIESSLLNYISSNYDYSNDDYQNYGISQNSDTKDYILVFETKYIKIYCKKCDQEYEVEEQQYHEIEKQFNETQEYRKENLLSIKNNQLTTQTQAIYTSRLLNPYTKNLSKYDTMEITDFTNL
ncbi:kinase-like domain-containing protein [Rhizophagus irregularis DAOM 181602=DAOM 197198]|nr:kinase-like domain-containing protein [Rhizophagus irregularis DAOM 181602=DAOM 197198]